MTTLISFTAPFTATIIVAAILVGVWLWEKKKLLPLAAGAVTLIILLILFGGVAH